MKYDSESARTTPDRNLCGVHFTVRGGVRGIFTSNITCTSIRHVLTVTGFTCVILSYIHPLSHRDRIYMSNITCRSIHFLTATGFTCLILFVHSPTFSRRQKYGYTLSSISLSMEPVTTLKSFATDESTSPGGGIPGNSSCPAV